MPGFRSHIRNLTHGYGIRENIATQGFVRTTQRHGGNRYSSTGYHAQPVGRRRRLAVEANIESDFQAS
jgi:hypothetical protein